ncbi:TPA: hypothetical protein SMO35_001252 [Pseudomonas aeruginosa]|nr:hypothetical protein [Pseudomonas aeruginosa]HCW0407077.1 hypothetical protein [Pseudomonas aeruginosa]HEK0206637.1 hypothetical protein [Pseudomonas aeruginosa]
MTRAADENEILDSLGRIISTHADWLDGCTFQRLCQQVARAYFEEQDLDSLVPLTIYRKAPPYSTKP